MTNEKFIEVLIEDYRDVVSKLILSSYAPMKKSLNIRELNFEVGSLGIGTVTPSLSEDEWYELVFELAPDVYESICYSRYAA